MTTPAVTVLMPVYNGEQYLREAMDSILNQTFRDFEFLIVDDGSTDETPRILEEYAQKDARIRIVRNEKNIRIAASLNKGLELATSPLIARMDADDISLPRRLETQLRFLRDHPEVAVCGSFMAYHDMEGTWSGAVDDATIRARMLFVCPLAHPTTMFRRDVILNTGGYDEAMPPAEDYALWANLAEIESVRLANIPKILLRYRTHPQLMRCEYWQKQRESAALVHKRLLERLTISPSKEDLNLHWACTGYVAISSRERLRAEKWMETVLQANASCRVLCQAALEREVMKRQLSLRKQTRGYIKMVSHLLRKSYGSARKLAQVWRIGN